MGRPVVTRKDLYVIALILGVVSLSYFNALSNGFAYDDVFIVQRNPLIRSWSNIPAIFSTPYWQPTGSSGGLYRPITIFSYLLEFSIAGPVPTLYHLDNILLHFLCCVLAYLVIVRITGNETGSAAASLLFAAHPVHVEAVANIVGRAELLSTFFTLAALYTFIIRPKRVHWYIISPLMLFLGLLSKETAVVLPLLILVYLLLFERDGRGKDVARVATSLAPYALVTALFLAIRFAALAGEIYPQGMGQVLIFTKGYWRMLVMFRVFLNYIRLSLLPTDLQISYMLRPPDSILSPVVLVFFGVVGGIAALSPWLIRNKRWIFFFIAWYFIAFLPASNIIPIGILMAERSMYLPTVGSCALLGLAFSWAYVRSSKAFSVRSASIPAVLLAVVLLCFGMLAHKRNKVWQGTESINWAHLEAVKRAVEEFPESSLYYAHLGQEYHELEMDEEALAALKKAVEIEPTAFAVMELAKTYRDMKRYDLALQVVQKGLSYAGKAGVSGYKPVYVALIAEIYYMNGMPDKARHFAQLALADDTPMDNEGYGNMAIYLYNIGMVKEAEDCILKSIGMNPLFPINHLNYGYILVDRGDDAAALAEFREAARLKPDMAEAHYEIGLILGRRGEFAGALAAMKKAVSLKPENASYHYYLAAAYIGVGQKNRAVEELNRALFLRPDYPEASQLLESLK